MGVIDGVASMTSISYNNSDDSDSSIVDSVVDDDGCSTCEISSLMNGLLDVVLSAIPSDSDDC